MPLSNPPIHGIVQGDAIHLPSGHGLSEGQPVEIVAQTSADTRWGEGLSRCAGALASDASSEDERILDEIYESRGSDNRQEIDG